jgi:hypothetical protein
MLDVDGWAACMLDFIEKESLFVSERLLNNIEHSKKLYLDFFDVRSNTVVCKRLVYFVEHE